MNRDLPTLPKYASPTRTLMHLADRAFRDVETQEPDMLGFRVRVDPSLPPNRAVITSAGQRTVVHLTDPRQEDQP